MKISGDFYFYFSQLLPLNPSKIISHLNFFYIKFRFIPLFLLGKKKAGKSLAKKKQSLTKFGYK
jgi:EamA domain-containing membrane protein RarD